MMQILITGATGFIGGHLIRHLSNIGYDILAWSRPLTPPNGLSSYAKYLSVDLLKDIPQIKVDVCIHCAGYATDVGDWETFYRNNVITTQNLFKTVEAKRWINISSSSIYPISDQLLTETSVDETNFPSLYGKSKYLAEQYLKKNIKSNQTVINLRPRAVYGNNDRVLLPRMLKLGKKGVVKLPGGGNVKLSMTHISNFIHAVELGIKSKHSGFHTYNVADVNPYLLKDVIQKVNEGFLDKKVSVKSVSPTIVRSIVKLSSLFGKPFPLSMQAFDYITTPTIISTNKIKKELGYRPKANFFDEVDKITAWAKKVSSEKIYSADKSLAWTNF